MTNSVKKKVTSAIIFFISIFLRKNKIEASKLTK